ncbi:hypothetical protein MNBD_NITROSPINAE02-1576 [hydrothermal vent metagenome]|uniref:Uncharacterized protein n=1 Tax=hydrothermal vent metagenome TaxID=652676 RepID=A0A3B1BFI5_9ZZZZ
MKPHDIVLKTRGLVGEPYMVKALLYALFFIGALAVFAYARFPSEVLAPLIERHASTGPFRVSVSMAKLSFPPGVSLSGVTVTEKSPAGASPLVTAESVTVRPSVIAALTGEEGGALEARLLGGELFVSGRTDGGADEKINMEFELEDINPGLLAIWEQVPWGKFSGKLSGEGNLSIVNQNIYKGAGELKASLSEGLFTLGKILSSDGKAVRLGAGQFELKYKSGKMTIDRAEINGDDVAISVSGDILLVKRLEFSRLNLKISIKLSGELKQKFDPLLAFFKKDNTGRTIIHISGVARAPSVR